MDYILIPEPERWRELPGHVTVDRKLWQAVNTYTLSSDLPDGITYTRESSLPSEGYTLEIRGDSITVASSDEPGLFYAMQTMRQLLRHSDDGRLHNQRIEDSPHFRHRGVMLDISRNKVPSMQTIFRLVDLWAELKLNQLQLYTEHTFAYRAHEKVWKDASPFTAEEIVSLNQYYAERAIDLVPNQNSFGHMERWLKHEKYRPLAESPEGYRDPSGIFIEEPSTLDPSSPDVIPFLRSLYDELLPNFSSSILNVGCDETFDLGQGRSRRLCEEIGTGRVYLDFIRKLAGEVSSRGLRMQFYGDIIVRYPELIPELPDGLIALDWGYEADHPFEQETAAFAAAGLEFYVCAGTSAWNSIAGRWNNALKNIRSAAYHGEKNGASGFMITEWGDNGHLQQYPVPLPGYLAGAAAAWSGEKGTYLDFEKILSIHYLRDKTGKAAQAMLLMADCYEQYSKKMHNGSIFAYAMLEVAYPGYRDYYPVLKDIDFKTALEVIPAAKRLLEEARLDCDDGDLVKEELLFTAELLRHGMELTVALFETEKMQIGDIPKEARLTLSRDLSRLIPQFERLWLLRNREGGMKDSSELLYRLDLLYRGE